MNNVNNYYNMITHMTQQQFNDLLHDLRKEAISNMIKAPFDSSFQNL